MNKILFSFIAAIFISQINGQTTILNTDFQNGIPIDYTIFNQDALIPAASVIEYSAAWIMKADPNNNLDSVVSATSYFSPVGKANRWIITSPIALGAYGNILEWKVKSHDASFPDSYKVLISTTDNQISSFTDTLKLVYGASAEWDTVSVNLSTEGYNNQTVYIAFVLISYNAYILYLDDIKAVKEDPLTVEDKVEIAFSIYPNPASTSIQIKSEEPIGNVLIFNNLGEIIYNGKEQAIDVSNFASGSYIIKIQTEKGMGIHKLIKL